MASVTFALSQDLDRWIASQANATLTSKGAFVRQVLLREAGLTVEPVPAEPTMKSRMVVTLPDDLAGYVEQIAKTEFQTRSTIIRRALHEFRAKRKRDAEILELIGAEG